MAITVLATVVIREGQHEKAVAELTAYAQHVRSEPGTLVFQIFSDPEVPGNLTVLELYADQQALQVHADSPQRALLGERLEDFADSVTVRWLAPLAGHGFLPSSV